MLIQPLTYRGAGRSCHNMARYHLSSVCRTDHCISEGTPCTCSWGCKLLPVNQPEWLNTYCTSLTWREKKISILILCLFFTFQKLEEVIKSIVLSSSSVSYIKKLNWFRIYWSELTVKFTNSYKRATSLQAHLKNLWFRIHKQMFPWNIKKNNKRE